MLFRGSLVLLLIFTITTFVICANKKSNKSDLIIFLPLDERFTTRDIFLNIAQIGDMEIMTPPKNILCKLRQPTDIQAMDDWFVGFFS